MPGRRGYDRRAMREMEDLRSRHQVRLVSDEEEGIGIDRLPRGVYGFTYSPAAENFPLFRKQDLNSYEAHKLPDGNAVLLGYLTREEADRLESAEEATVLHLFPNAKGEAGTLVILPMARVVGHREYSQREGKGLEVRVGPARR
ncbi:MAG TPA: hypothetical protein VJB88_10175 [Vicinamibacteria bacterium]|nr:hypothetical protein [Vicinamibacteria bacterium]